MKTQEILNLNYLKIMDIGPIKKCIFLYLFIGFFASVLSQNSISFSLNSEYRITPIYLNNSYFQIGDMQPSSNVDEQISGTSIAYLISYNFYKEKYNISFKHSLRRDLLVYENSNLNNSDLNKPLYTFINDYHFAVERNFKLKNDFVLGLKIGYSLMNRGTEYRYIKTYDDIPDVYVILDSNLNFNAYSFNIGVSKKKLSFYIGSHFVENNNFSNLNENVKILIPNFQLQYKIFEIK